MTLVEAGFWSVVHGLVAPAVIVPALVVGWMAPRTLVAVVGGVAIAAALFLFSHWVASLPEGAVVIWWLMPLALIPPIAWSVGSHLAFRSLRAMAGDDRSHPGLRLVDAVVGAVIGAVLGGGAALLAGSIFVEVAQVSSFEGGAGYLVVFGFGFPGLVLGTLVGAFLGWRRRRRRAQPASQTDSKQTSAN